MIFTESTIKISNNVSKMDSTIVLYRGDKNVEIRFTILQSPFKYSNTVATNVIESTNASYGQLVIKTPNDKPPIFSEVSATKEGTILFTITKEMIDEIEEVGAYTFQIRLMDDNKQSRATIPPVENGIEIKEPIAIEDDNTTNVVGLAKANYAVATLSDVDTPTFDDAGKYIKTNWNDGDIITNTSLNKIEDGIYTTNENVTATKKYVDDKVTIKILPVDYNKNCATNVADLEPNSIYMSPNDAKFLYLGYEKLEGSFSGFFLSGNPHGKFIYTGTKDDTKIEVMLEGICYTAYFKTDTVDAHTEKSVFYLTKNNNKEFTPTYDYEPATKKYVDDIKTGIDGVTTNLSNLLDVDYDVISNNCIDDSKYVGKNFDSIFGHSGNKKFKLAKKFTSNQIKGYIELEDGTAPSTAFQIYLTSSVGGAEDIQLSIGGTLVVSDDFDKFDTISVDCWQTYDKNIKTFFIGNYADEYDNFKTQPKSKAINNMESKLTNIRPEQCSFFTKVDNLLKNVTLQKGYAINSNYGMPDKLTGIERTTTDFMELRDDCKSTYCNINGYIYYYDANKKYLQSISPQNLETPAGIVALPQSDTKIKYIRYTFVTEDDAALSSYWITDQGKPYENDKMYLPNSIIEGIDKTESWYKGKKICAYGDSIVEQNKWQAYVASYFGCSFYNRGVGGTTVTQVNSSTNHMSADSRIETIPTDSDVILVLGGHNDWSSASINIGDIKTDELSESASFKAAFALMLKKIQTRCPNAKIITMTPVGGRTEEASVNQDKQFYIRDLCMTDFANAVKEISAYYGIPCIDINANSGINTLNHTTYISDVIHPNVEGGKLIANEVVNGLKRFEPIIF